MKASEIKGKVDFGIITVREDEFRAVLKRFHPEDFAYGNREYSMSRLQSDSGGEYLIAAVRCPEQGEKQGQDMARDMIEDLDPQWLVLVGISGGVPSNDFTLGDVLLANRLYDFSVEAALQGRPSEYSLGGGPMQKVIQIFLASLAARELKGQFEGWNHEDSIGMKAPSISLRSTNFYGSPQWQEKVKASLRKHFKRSKLLRPPLFAVGPTASSDRLMKNADLLEEWRTSARHTANVEMELAGVYEAARRVHREYPILAIRGVSDIVGFKRNDSWTEYACQTAAAFAHALIKAGPLQPRSSASQGTTNEPDANLQPQVNDFNSSGQALTQLRTLSRIVEADAKLIIHDEALGGDVCLDQHLYVTRSVEEKVIRNLNASEKESNITVVVGEAGRGKTSLLWKLYQSLKEEGSWETWFLKSTMLLTPSSPASMPSRGGITYETILSATSAATNEGKRPLLLLDTLDLLLHDEASRNFLLGLLFDLTARGCTVVATCRPPEVSLLNPVEYRRATLVDYEGPELEEAIRKHAARLYAPSAQHDREDYAKEILEAVARGLPIREVCENPLTLRMLFTIYAPSRVASDVNVFELYKLYWTHRVEQDYRAGSPFPAVTVPNLERAAAASALAMLAEGMPELSADKLLRVVKELEVTSGELDALSARGVLLHSADGTVSFFHQTFFEHSAARGLLRFFAFEAIPILKRRLEFKPNDLFTSPVYEQVLLLAEEAPHSVSARADEAVIDLIESAALSSLMSAIYVYCHRREIAPAVEQVMRSRLAQAEEAVQIRFLELAPNVPKHRLEKLIEELDLIWESGTSRVREHLVVLLERLVPRGHDKVARFVERHDLIKYVFDLVPPFNVSRMLLNVLKAVSSYDPQSGWERLIKFCGTSTLSTRGRELSVAIVKFLVEKAEIFGAEDIATRFEADTARFKLDQARDFDELADMYGNLWRVEWSAAHRSVYDVLAEVSTLPEGMSLVTKMRGLGRLLRSASEGEASLALSQCEQEKRHYYRAMWIEGVMPNWLRALDHDGERESGSVKYLRTYVRNKLIEDDGIEQSRAMRNLLIQAIREAELSSPSFIELVVSESFPSPEPWLDKDRLAYLLVDGFVAKHPGATEAMRLLKENPHAYWRTLDRAVGPRLVKKIFAVPAVMDSLFEITLKVEDAAFILRAIETMTRPLPPSFLNWTERISSFCKRIMNLSVEPQKRRYAIMIWDHLLTLGLSPFHTLDELVRLVNSEVDMRARGYLVSMIGRSAAGMKYDMRSVLNILVPIAKSADDELRRRGMLALAKASSEFQGDVSPYVDEILQTVLSPPATAERLSALRPLIERLLRSDVELAASVFRKLIMGAMEVGIGTSGRQKLFGRLKPTARVVVRLTTPEARKELLKIVPNLDRVLGSLVLDAICHEVLIEFPNELDELLRSDVAGEVKETILKYRYTQERSLGGKEWPELYHLFASSGGKSTIL
jgi:nucleoside phosphorylase/energy-coupling factor transporter ATP-binding protein EcfA2